MSLDTYQQLAGDIVEKARRRGATASECTISEGDEFSANVRLGEVENLKEAGSRGVGLRVLIGQRAGSAYTSDFTAEGIERMIDSAVELARVSGEDQFAGLPDEAEQGRLNQDLELFSDDVLSLDTSYKIEQARRAEKAALSVDPRVTNSEGASFDSYLGLRVFANSHGFVGGYRSSSCSLSTVPVGREGDTMERDYWFSIARGAAGLEDPESIGRRAAERVARRLGARKVTTQKVPVIFEPRTAGGLLSSIFEAVSGSSVYRKETFLADRLGETVASPLVTVIDDATIPGLFGSSPFDDEGVPSRRTTVIEQGVLRSYLLNSYTARKLGMRTTGNASRGITGNAGVGHGNLYLEPGQKTPQEIIGSIRQGLYITELMGFGVNVVTGDYSRGAAGLWIENGELAYPVSEITVASTLQQMLKGIVAIGSDLEFRGSVAAPTLMIEEMTISGR